LHVLELEDRIFSFAISCPKVGLHMINSKFVSNSPFKVFFLPWNSSGLASARLSIKEDQCPSPPWYHVGRKRKKNNLEQHHHLSSSRSCILVKSVFSRLVFPNPNSSSRAEDPSKSVWISSRPKVSKFHSFADAVKSPVHILTGANAVLFSQDQLPHKLLQALLEVSLRRIQVFKLQF
jgi:hypothetical protein